jgi:hypothetical protein
MFWFIMVQLVIYGLLAVALGAFLWYCLGREWDDADDETVSFVFRPIVICLLLCCLGMIIWGVLVCL